MMGARKCRVLHAPSSVGGNPQALSLALKALGVDSTSLVVSQNYLSYGADVVLHRPGGSFLLREVKRVWAVLFYLPRFDVIHYNAGTTVASAYGLDFPMAGQRDASSVLRFLYAGYLRALQKLELFLVTTMRKAVFVTYQGDDARQGDYSLQHFAISIAAQVEPGYYDAVSDQFKRKNILLLSSVARGVYAVNPDLLHVLPPQARFVPYSLFFMTDWIPVYSQAEPRPLRIVHAPSHRKVKGTALILKAFANLKDRGYKFDVLLVEGLSNAEARKVYESADLLVDQLFAGWYGGLAVELMALGKPVLVYLRDGDLHFLPPEMRRELPCIQVTADTVEQELQRVLDMPRAALVELGKRSRAYVERWHDPLKIAADIKRDYEAALQRSRG